MSEELTDDRIALLCEIAESDLPKLTEDKKRDQKGLSPGVTRSRRRAIRDQPLGSLPRPLLFSANVVPD